MNRYIRGYNTKTDKLIFEIELRNVPVTELRTALRITNDNPLYDCYPITLEVENILKSLNGLEILDRRDTEYFLEADAQPADPARNIKKYLQGIGSTT